MGNSTAIENSMLFGFRSEELEPNTISFKIDNIEYIKINKKGFYVKGKKVADDKELYYAFKEWLENAKNEV